MATIRQISAGTNIGEATPPNGLAAPFGGGAEGRGGRLPAT